MKLRHQYLHQLLSCQPCLDTWLHERNTCHLEHMFERNATIHQYPSEKFCRRLERPKHQKDETEIYACIVRPGTGAPKSDAYCQFEGTENPEAAEMDIIRPHLESGQSYHSQE